MDERSERDLDASTTNRLGRVFRFEARFPVNSLGSFGFWSRRLSAEHKGCLVCVSIVWFLRLRSLT